MLLSALLFHFFYSTVLLSFCFSPVKFLIKQSIMSGSKFLPCDLVLYYLAALKTILFWELPNMLHFVKPQQLEASSNYRVHRQFHSVLDNIRLYEMRWKSLQWFLFAFPRTRLLQTLVPSLWQSLAHESETKLILICNHPQAIQCHCMPSYHREGKWMLKPDCIDLNL